MIPAVLPYTTTPPVIPRPINCGPVFGSSILFRAGRGNRSEQGQVSLGPKRGRPWKLNRGVWTRCGVRRGTRQCSSRGVLGPVGGSVRASGRNRQGAWFGTRRAIGWCSVTNVVVEARRKAVEPLRRKDYREIGDGCKREKRKGPGQTAPS